MSDWWTSACPHWLWFKMLSCPKTCMTTTSLHWNVTEKTRSRNNINKPKHFYLFGIGERLWVIHRTKYHKCTSGNLTPDELWPTLHHNVFLSRRSITLMTDDCDRGFMNSTVRNPPTRVPTPLWPASLPAKPSGLTFGFPPFPVHVFYITEWIVSMGWWWGRIVPVGKNIG